MLLLTRHKEFGGGRYHTLCFKCTACFGTLKSGDKVFSSRHNASQPVCEACVMQQHEAKECLVSGRANVRTFPLHC